MLRTTHLIWLPVLAAALLALACDGGSGGGKTATPSAPETPTAAPSPPSASCPMIDGRVVQGVIAVLELDDDTYPLGEPVEMTMRLVNCSYGEVKRVYPSEQRYDFSVAVVGGDEVWRWSEGQSFNDEQTEITLESGDEVTAVETWEQVDNDGQPAEAGSYEITAESTACDESLQNCEALATHVIEIVAP